MKKGFTLIELLAVIVILAIILLVVMPMVLNVINQVKKSAFEASAYGYLKTAESVYAKDVLADQIEAKLYKFKDSVQTGEESLKFSGIPPRNGYIYVFEDGRVVIVLEDGLWLAIKSPDEKEVTIEKLEEQNLESIFYSLSGVSVVENFIFGENPENLDGVDFFDGTPESGMIVFKTPGTYLITPYAIAEIEVLVVAGGGGGEYTGSGGGGGGFLYNPAYTVTTSTLTVEVGNGGAGGDHYLPRDASNGGNSTFNDLVAIGGGRGQKHGWGDGYSGGSGGGAPIKTSSPAGTGGAGVTDQGKKGGDGFVQASWVGCSGGGGGAGSEGIAGGNSPTSCRGGNGLQYFGAWYSGGGGGGEVHGTYAAIGGLGGGGKANMDADGDSGANYLGGGGAGGSYGGTNPYKSGGDGGSGIVIVRWGGYDVDYDPLFQDYITGLGQYVYVPIGAEGYDKEGNLVISYEKHGTLQDEGGKIVFREEKVYESIKIAAGAYKVLVVGGGGSGGTHMRGGGGGAGGLIFVEEYEFVDEELVLIEVGSGGLGTQSGPQNNGGDSIFRDLIALGGGAGGLGESTTYLRSGRDGGSGGGGNGSYSGTKVGGLGLQPSSSSSGFGNNGGTAGGMVAGGGGGGASTIGANAGTSNGGNGGNGRYYGNVFGDNLGDNGWFAGGGGGGRRSSGTAGLGGAGGGGRGGTTGGTAENGLANTGGGAGGIGDGGISGTGGSGIVIIKWSNN